MVAFGPFVIRRSRVLGIGRREAVFAIRLPDGAIEGRRLASSGSRRANTFRGHFRAKNGREHAIAIPPVVPSLVAGVFVVAPLVLRLVGKVRKGVLREVQQPIRILLKL